MSYERFYFWVNSALVELPEREFLSSSLDKLGVRNAPCCDTHYVGSGEWKAWGYYGAVISSEDTQWSWKGQTKAEMPPEFLLQLMLIGVPI